jgi:site-specific DNA-cytosine methylase
MNKGDKIIYKGKVYYIMSKTDIGGSNWRFIMKIIYLGAYKAQHDNYDIVYQDINGQRDLDGDMLDIDLTPYDIIIATPPCNYWSRANQKRDESEYALKTKHLLPGIIKKLIEIDKPFIVENVRNYKLFEKHNLINLPLFIYEHGRHTYWTNIAFNPKNIKQIDDLLKVQTKSGKRPGHWTISQQRDKRQGGTNVHNVIEHWLKLVIN